jgi:hypothetical protein
MDGAIRIANNLERQDSA